ncbi:hypothetical protein HDV03_001625 [Kappamyces sp. JEL0829]|nr:hypothetical protein HDV03_001625 [Kappamyces sp. JEL0829]
MYKRQSYPLQSNLNTKPSATLLRKQSLKGNQGFPWGYPHWLPTESLQKKSLDETTVGSRSKYLVNFSSLFRPKTDKGGKTGHAAPGKTALTLSETLVSLDSVESIEVPSSQHQPTVDTLLPHDIGLVACVGDSLLTGLGVSSQPYSRKNQFLTMMGNSFHATLMLNWAVSGEHRHNTCITGGSEGVVSMARLLQVYSPSIQGLSLKKTPLFSKGDAWNLARTGATVKDISGQVQALIRKLQASPALLHDTWKLLFVWIGANDAFSKSMAAIERDFKKQLLQALLLLKAHVPKAFVVLLPLPSLSHLIGDVSPEKAMDIKTKTEKINSIVADICQSYNWKTGPDFKLVLEPIPSEDISTSPEYSSIQAEDMISPLDNIHPSYIANQLFCKCIWNNLFLGPGEKMNRLRDVVEAQWAHPPERLSHPSTQPQYTPHLDRFYFQ